MNRRITALLFVLAGLSSFTAAFAESFDREVIWSDASHKSAIFVPEVLLRGDGMSLLPAWARDALATVIMSRKSGAIPCTVDLYGTPEPDINAKLLVQALEAGDLVFTGDVVATVPGWSSWHTQATLLVWLRVREVLVDARNSLKAGSLVAFMYQAASVTLDDVRLCSERPGFDVPATGMQFLIEGSHSHDDSRLVEARHFFPVSGDTIREQPFRDVQRFGRAGFESVRQELTRSTEKSR